MSTHNIGFYEDLTKVVFQLSSPVYVEPYRKVLKFSDAGKTLL